MRHLCKAATPPTARAPDQPTHADHTPALPAPCTPQLLVTFAEPQYILCGRSWSVTAKAWNGVAWSDGSAAKSVVATLCHLG